MVGQEDVRLSTVPGLPPEAAPSQELCQLHWGARRAPSCHHGNTLQTEAKGNPGFWDRPTHPEMTVLKSQQNSLETCQECMRRSKHRRNPDRPKFTRDTHTGAPPVRR